MGGSNRDLVLDGAGVNRLKRALDAAFRAALTIMLFSCGSTPLAPSPLAYCRFPNEQGTPVIVDGRPDVQIMYHKGDGLGARLAADAATAFTAMSGVKFMPHAVTDVTDATVVLCQGDPQCPRHTIAVGQLALALETHPPQGQTVRTRLQILADDRRIWWLQGDGVLGEQIATYRFLQTLGVRYYHPRATYYPQRWNLSIDRSVEVTEAPGIKRRGWRLNTALPTEAVRPFLEPGLENLAQAEQVIDWLVANGQTYVEWTLLQNVPFPEWHTHARLIVAYARVRGLEVGIGVALNANPNGIYPIVNGNKDGATTLERLQALADDGFQEIDAELQASPFRPVSDADARAWTDTFTQAMARVSPSMRAALTIPATQEAKSDLDDGVPVFQTARFAPDTVAFNIAPVSFYSLFQDRSGFAEEDLDQQLRFLESQTGERPIAYAPQTSTWGGRDSDVPLFLPVFWTTRWQDANRLLAYPNIRSHLTSDAGWEWGYWANDAVVFAATWSPTFSFSELIDQVFGPLGRNTCNRFTDTLTNMAAEQSEGLIGSHLAPYVTGESANAKVFGAAGFPIQPIRPAYASLVTLTPAAAVTFETEVLSPLMNHLARWTAMERSLLPLIPRVDEPARPFVQEIIDGIGVTRLRLAHSVALLKAIQSTQRGDPTGAEAFLDDARDQTHIADLVISARESQYRYPIENLVGIYSNPTIYPYGYLHAAHSLKYWTEEEAEASRAMFGKE